MREMFSWSLSVTVHPVQAVHITVIMSEFCRNDLVDPANSERIVRTIAAMAQASVKKAVSLMLYIDRLYYQYWQEKRQLVFSTSLWLTLVVR